MSKKILIVDDEPDMVTFLSALLEDAGYVTISAADGNEAWNLIKSERPDLISLDLLMPDKTGIKVYRDLKKDDETKNIPVVMVTGLTKDDIPHMDFKEWIRKRSIKPPEAYIEKPVNRDRFLEVVRQAIR